MATANQNQKKYSAKKYTYTDKIVKDAQKSQVTGDPSKDKSESTVPKMSTFGHAEDKAKSVQDLQKVVEDEQQYEQAVETGTVQDSWKEGIDYWKDSTGKIYTDVHARNLADHEISKQTQQAKEKAASVADLQAEADINWALNKEEFRATEESYLTNYSGTVGDSYYKNEQGTGTGQGGSGTGYGTGSNTYTYSGYEEEVVETTPIYDSNDTTDTTVHVTDWGNVDTKSISPFSIDDKSEIPPLSAKDFITLNGLRTGAGRYGYKDQTILLSNVFNTVKFAPVWDGLTLSGVKFDVKMPLWHNKSGTKWSIGGG
jgi:hypothetical protein